MGLIVPDIAEPFLLSMIKNEATFAGIHLHLYKNNYTPVDATVLGDFTEANFDGYASEVPTFTIPAEVANKASMNDSSPRTFTHDGGAIANTVYGYYVTCDAGPVLMWAERFSAPVSMSALGDSLSVQLYFTLNSENH